MMVERKPWHRVATIKDVGGKTPAAIKSAARALRVLEFFDEVRRGARANEISERLDIPQSSASFLLNSLVQLGYLDIDFATHVYTPTLRVAMLGNWLDRGHFRDGRILDMVEKLSDRTGFAIGLSTRSGIHVRYLQAIQAQSQGSLHIPLSTRRYAVWSSAGIVLLTDLGASELTNLIRRTKAERDPFVERIDYEAVVAHVAAARRDGYFLSKGLVTPIAGSLSMRLPAAVTGSWQAIAISMNGDLDTMVADEANCIAILREAVADVANGD